MGKGFNNYMCKKFFHPASRDNLKRVWMAEQKQEAYKKKQEELRVQYEKEQDLYNNKALLWKDSKEKLSLNFMYDPPPGLVKEKDKNEVDEENQTKFEWQRKFNAPREDYCKGDTQIRDQPFGIRVRNVRCIKCHNMGHLNTDRECPLYNKSILFDDDSAAEKISSSVLVEQMQEEGLALKRAPADQPIDLIETDSDQSVESSDSSDEVVSGDEESENSGNSDETSSSEYDSDDTPNSTDSSDSNNDRIVIASRDRGVPHNGHIQNGRKRSRSNSNNTEYEEDIKYLNSIPDRDKQMLLNVLTEIEKQEAPKFKKKKHV